MREEPPTNDQLSNILEYLGPAKAGSVVSGASDVSDALRKFKDSEKAFQRPITVDWNNGRAGTSSRTRVIEAGPNGASDICTLRPLLMVVQSWGTVRVRS